MEPPLKSTDIPTPICDESELRYEDGILAKFEGKTIMHAEDGRKLERENVTLAKELAAEIDKSCQTIIPLTQQRDELKAENDDLRFTIQKQCDNLLDVHKALSLTKSEISSRWVKREVLEKLLNVALMDDEQKATCGGACDRIIQEARIELGKGEK